MDACVLEEDTCSMLVVFVCLFVAYLKTLFNNSDYIASNEKVTNTPRIGKNVE
jgi:hypothetical protein